MEFVLIAAILIAIIAFALIGFFQVLRWLINGHEEPDRTPPPSRRNSIDEDVAASRRLLAYLFRNKQVTETTYYRLTEFLESNFGNDPSRSMLDTTRSAYPARSDQPPTDTAQLVPDQEIEIVQASVVEDQPRLPAAGPSVPEVEVRFEQSGPRQHRQVQDRPSDRPPVTEGESVARAANEAKAGPSPATVAPWDQPDPEPRPPRRSFGEVLSGFMQEKNMRWGELTSGILIVLSAVGLVISLRDQLSDAIPYFSSILFMLITGAIIGAGVYTLKKWKLRNTSRGTLVIGLLLVPLNFVAACVLSGGENRRELDDPWLWFAMAIGVIGFGWLTHWASRYLLRKNYSGLVIGLIGCGVGAVVVNRLVIGVDSGLRQFLISLPLVACFVAGSGIVQPRAWRKRHFSTRATNRMYLMLGISVFGLLSSLSLFVIRGDSLLQSTVVLTPALIVVSLIISWLGGVQFHSLVQPESGVVNDALITKKREQQLVGLILHVLGMGLTAVFLVTAASHPGLLLIGATIVAIGLASMSVHQRSSFLLPAAWTAVGVAALSTTSFVTGQLEIDQWATATQLQAALVNGRSGLSLLAVGGIAFLLQTGLAARVADRNFAARLRRSGLLSGGLILLVGCGLAVIASFVNRDDVFDNQTASALLMIAGLGTWWMSIQSGRRTPEVASENRDRVISIGLANGAAVLLLAGLAHAILWNPVMGNWVQQLVSNVPANWVIVFGVHAVLMGVAAACPRRGADQLTLQNWTLVSTCVAVVGAILLVPHQTGIATLMTALACLALGLIGISMARDGEGNTQIDNSGLPLATGTLLLVAIGIADLGPTWIGCPPYTEWRHWLVQTIGISIWALAWTTVASGIKRRRSDGSVLLRRLVASQPRLDQLVVLGLVVFLGTVIVASLANGVLVEIYAQTGFAFSLASDQREVFLAMTAVAVTLCVMLMEQPSRLHGMGLVGVWLLTFAFAANEFESSRAVASAVRWSIPIGGLVGALLVGLRHQWIPGWIVTRNKLGLPGRSTWRRDWTQQLINFALVVIAGVVLFLSTMTVSQVLLNGADSLGGPEPGSWFGKMDKVVSFGVPVALVVTTFLAMAISERRPWLATAGSAVFQYVVILAIVLLFLSPHPKLASAWFVQVLQAVSLGMTTYGFAWFLARNRIGTGEATGTERPTGRWLEQIETHTLINGLLVSSLAVLVYGRYFLFPALPGGWINTIGNLPGIIAWIGFAGLAWLVFRSKWQRVQFTTIQVWGIAWLGLILVAMVTAITDYNFERFDRSPGWIPFQVLAIGTTVVTALQVAALLVLPERKNVGAETGIEPDPALRHWSFGLNSLSCSILLTSVVGLLFATRGCMDHGQAFWIYFLLMMTQIIILMWSGIVTRFSIFSLVAASLVPVLAGLLVLEGPIRFDASQPWALNLTFVGLSMLAIAQLVGGLVLRKRGEPSSYHAVMMPNIAVLVCSTWILIAGIFQLICSSSAWATTNPMLNLLGLIVMIATTAVLVFSLWNDRRLFWVAGFCLSTIGIVMVLVSAAAPSEDACPVWAVLATGLTVAGWGWFRRSWLLQKMEQGRAADVPGLVRALDRQLPIYASIVTGFLVIVSFFSMFYLEDRLFRYLVAVTPIAAAFGFGCLAISGRRWMQLVCLMLVSVGCLFTGWADLSQDQMWEASGITTIARGVLVLAGLMFVYGALVTRWVREGDRWIRSLREMAAVTCGFAMLGLLVLLAVETTQFDEQFGCGLSIAEAVSVAVVGVAMMVGLVSIAIRPERDPFSLSLKGRQAYVYIAQLVAAGIALHVYLSMPQLFRFGIKEYWPYLAMLICFGGVGVANLLQQRKLEVLGEPIFTTAAILPLLIAAAVFGVDSQARPDVVILMVGLAYLLISYTNRSVLAGAAAVLFGNLALWLFYGSFPQFSFLAHPQLWLIPPAVSALIAAQLFRRQLTSNQLISIRYVCATVVYISSTSEIFIRGLGDQLWPPMILAFLAVVGILSGILLQVRSFLYFGSLFLLVAMISMVAHAHQRFEHVWPWWAFGITLGLAILVMFGLFEKKKNEMKALGERLRDWDQ